MLNILVLEDQEMEMEKCVQSILKITPDANIIEARGESRAIEKSEEIPIDIFFLDIGLLDGNGLEFAERIREKSEYKLTHIVFITGQEIEQPDIYKQYHHYEYISKPYEFLQFEEAVSELLLSLDKKKKELEHVLSPKTVAIKAKSGRVFVRCKDILYVEKRKGNQIIHLEEQEIQDAVFKLEKLIKEIDEPSFVRCHKSYAVNIRKIRCIISDESHCWEAQFYNTKKTCPIGDKYRKSVEELMRYQNRRAKATEG